MEKIKFLLKVLFVTSALFFISGIFAKASYAAPRLYLDPSTKTVVKDNEFQITLGIDAESNNVFGADAKIIFPQGDLELKSISDGGFFKDFSSAFSQSGGTIEIHGYFSSLYETKSGSGSMAVIKFLAKKDSGSGTIAFVCSGSPNDTQILNSSGSNILTCGNLNQLNLTYAATQTPTNPPATNPPSTGGTGGTTTTGGTNGCGGPCGSDANCNSGLYCFYGFCRNPACGNELNCVCPLTSYPTAKPKIVVATSKKTTSTPTPIPTPVPEIQIADITPYVAPTAVSLAQEEVTQKKSFPILPAIIVGSIIGILLFISKKLKGKNNPPQINPPVNPPIIEPPMPINYPPFTPPVTPPPTPPTIP